MQVALLRSIENEYVWPLTNLCAKFHAFLDIGDKESPAASRRESAGDRRDAVSIRIRFDHSAGFAVRRQACDGAPVGDDIVEVHAGTRMETHSNGLNGRCQPRQASDYS